MMTCANFSYNPLTVQIKKCVNEMLLAFFFFLCVARVSIEDRPAAGFLTFIQLWSKRLAIAHVQHCWLNEKHKKVRFVRLYFNKISESLLSLIWTAFWHGNLIFDRNLFTPRCSYSICMQPTGSWGHCLVYKVFSSQDVHTYMWQLSWILM